MQEQTELQDVTAPVLAGPRRLLQGFQQDFALWKQKSE